VFRKEHVTTFSYLKLY